LKPLKGSGWFTYNLMDGRKLSANGSMGWSSNSNINSNHSESITVDTGSIQTIREADLYPRNDGANAGYGFPIDFTIQPSSDGTNWTTVLTQSVLQLPTGAQKYLFTPFSARYVKVTGTNLRPNPNDNNTYRMQLAEIEIY